MRFNYVIYQVKRGLSRDYGYQALNWLEDQGKDVTLDNYDKLYSSTMESTESVFVILEKLYEEFNIKRELHPNFSGHSMSMGDIVQIHNRFFYCDFVGWVEIEFVARRVKQD